MDACSVAEDRCRLPREPVVFGVVVGRATVGASQPGVCVRAGVAAPPQSRLRSATTRRAPVAASALAARNGPHRSPLSGRATDQIDPMRRKKFLPSGRRASDRQDQDRTLPVLGWPQPVGKFKNWAKRVHLFIYIGLRSFFIRSTPDCSRRNRGSPPSRSASDDDEPTLDTSARDRRNRHAQTPDPARRDRGDRTVPLGRLRTDGRVQVPEADPHRQPGGPLGRAGSARLHRQPSPRWLRSARPCSRDDR